MAMACSHRSIHSLQLLRSTAPLTGASVLSAYGWRRLCLCPCHRRVGSHVPYKGLVELRDDRRPLRATTQGFPSSKTTGIILGLLKRRLRTKLCAFAAILQICGLAGKIQRNHAWAFKKVFEAKLRQLAHVVNFSASAKVKNPTSANSHFKGFLIYKIPTRDPKKSGRPQLPGRVQGLHRTVTPFA